MDEDDKYTRITLRIPKELHVRLGDEADKTSKSLNAEIIARLQSTFKPELKTLNFSSQPEFVEFRKEMLDQVRKMIAGQGGEVVYKSKLPVKGKS